MVHVPTNNQQLYFKIRLHVSLCMIYKTKRYQLFYEDNPISLAVKLTVVIGIRGNLLS